MEQVQGRVQFAEIRELLDVMHEDLRQIES